MHLIYWLLSYLLFGLLLPLWMMHPKLREGTRRRLGFYGVERWPPSRGAGPRIWLHGASAGDLLALMPVLLELRRLSPDATLVVSALTNSGFAMAKDRLASLVDGITYVPYDLPGATQRAMRVIQPDLLLLEYTELWPNLIEAARSFGAEVALTNGRIGEGRVHKYRLLHLLIGNQLKKLSLLMMRSESEADRALMLGAPLERLKVTGNTKFDNTSRTPGDDAVRALGQALHLGDEPLLVAGSTHEGEERELLLVFKAMQKVAPRLRLLLAPRYVERSAKLLALARAEGLSAALRSEARFEIKSADVIILDTIGELGTAYGLATLVFVGGSFVPRGGQNILEPAGHGRPVLFGPYMMNFRDAVEVLLGRGAIQVQTWAQLERVGRELLSRPEELVHLGEMAKIAVQKARGASAANAALVMDLLARRRIREQQNP